MWGNRPSELFGNTMQALLTLSTASGSQMWASGIPNSPRNNTYRLKLIPVPGDAWGTHTELLSCCLSVILRSVKGRQVCQSVLQFLLSCLKQLNLGTTHSRARRSLLSLHHGFHYPVVVDSYSTAYTQYVLGFHKNCIYLDELSLETKK